MNPLDNLEVIILKVGKTTYKETLKGMAQSTKFIVIDVKMVWYCFPNTPAISSVSALFRLDFFAMK